MKTVRKEIEGVTLVELLVVVAVLGAVAMALFSTFYASSRSSDQAQIMAHLQQEARALMLTMSRDIRMAGSCPPKLETCESGCCDDSCRKSPGDKPGIKSADETELIITMDVRSDSDLLTPDGDCNDPGEEVTYRYENGRLCRKNSNDDQCESLVGGFEGDEFGVSISDFSFSYYDAEGNPTSDINQIAMVRVEATLESNRHAQGLGVFTYPIDFTVTIRNKVLGRVD